MTDTALETLPPNAIEVVASADRVDIGPVSVALVDHRFATAALRGGVNGLLVEPLSHLSLADARVAIIRADRTLSAGVIVRLLYTLAQQSISTFAFVATAANGPPGALSVQLPSSGSRVARTTHAETNALHALAALMGDAAVPGDLNVAPTPPAPAGPPSMRITDGAYVVTANTFVLQPDCASFQTTGITLPIHSDQGALRRCLVSARAAPTTHDAMAGAMMLLTVRPDETYDSIVQRLAALRESHAGARDLYTETALAVVL